jgi:hypothetical protein
MQRREQGLASLLGGLREQPKPEAADQDEAPSATATTKRRRKAPVKAATKAASPAAARPRLEREEGQGGGRSKTGKRSNPDYALRGLWLRNDTYLDATERLRRRREYSDASELVQALLDEWLRKG